MTRQPVISSNIKSVGHDPETNTLEVEFKDGGVYSFGNVDSDKHQSMMSAQSVGSHFHKHIKGKHPVV